MYNKTCNKDLVLSKCTFRNVVSMPTFLPPPNYNVEEISTDEIFSLQQLNYIHQKAYERPYSLGSPTREHIFHITIIARSSRSSSVLKFNIEEVDRGLRTKNLFLTYRRSPPIRTVR